VNPGEYWRFELSLRRPAGMSNPGGFDYEAWLYAQGIGALGSIRRGERLEEPVRTSPVVRLRQTIRDQLSTVLAGQPGGERLMALVVGDRSVLSREDWQVVQATGTAHLMVISGLHVGTPQQGDHAENRRGEITLLGRA